jgi:translocation and assembly module TamA
MQGLPRRGAVYLSASLFALAAVLSSGEARAFDFFGLFGSDDKPPAASQDALPYAVTFDITGEDDVESNLKDASTLYGLRDNAPPDGESLARRAETDFAPLIDALWASGYYNATVVIDVAGAPLQVGQNAGSAARSAEAYRGRAAVPVTVIVNTGPQFELRTIDVVEARTKRPFAREELPPRAIKLKPGDPATSAQLRAAQARMVDYFRAQSRPLAKAVSINPTVYHPAQKMDVSFDLAPGPVAPIGEIAVTGTETLDPAIVRSFIYINPGDPYSPQVLEETRKSVATLSALSGVRIRESEALDAQGRLPIFVEVTEREKLRVVGFSAAYSTVDGPAIRAYWEHRNLFGGSESLRLEAETFLAPRNDGTEIKRVGDLERSDIGARLRATFVKPALYGTRNDLLIDGIVERNRTGGDRFGGYTVRMAGATGAIRHRFTDTFSVQGGVQVQKGQTSDVLGQIDYTVVGTPLSVTYDSTDRPLDPTRGAKITASVTPYPAFLGSTVNMVVARATASTYYSLDEDSDYILAGRIGVGSIGGPSLDEIPSNFRFFAGGGGSVRGYRYQSLAPTGPFGFVVGGRSLLEGSLEARIKVTDTIGIVPFVDAGGAFESSYPDFKDKVHVAAGLGLRYYTAIGPIRLDVAAPIDRRPGDRPVSLYVSIGQSF